MRVSVVVAAFRSPGLFGSVVGGGGGGRGCDGGNGGGDINLSGEPLVGHRAARLLLVVVGAGDIESN